MSNVSMEFNKSFANAAAHWWEHQNGLLEAEVERLKKALAQVTAEERERCAKICEAFGKRAEFRDERGWVEEIAQQCADEIRGDRG